MPNSGSMPNPARVRTLASVIAHHAGVLAHQGGWDEVLLIVVPMMVIVGLLRLAKRRVERQQLVERQGDTSTPSKGDQPPTSDK